MSRREASGRRVEARKQTHNEHGWIVPQGELGHSAYYESISFQERSQAFQGVVHQMTRHVKAGPTPPKELPLKTGHVRYLHRQPTAYREDSVDLLEAGNRLGDVLEDVKKRNYVQRPVRKGHPFQAALNQAQAAAALRRNQSIEGRIQTNSHQR